MHLPSAEHCLAVASARSLTGRRAVAPDAVPLPPAGSITTACWTSRSGTWGQRWHGWVEPRQDTGQRCRCVFPAGGRRCADPQGSPGLLAAQRHRPAHRRRRGGQLKDFAVNISRNW